MDVSIIIVSYNTKFYLEKCILSIFKWTKDIDFEVIVSDNGSIDDSIEMIKTEFPKVKIIENNKNIGFGKANNQALKVAKGKYIFYLNSDTELLNNAVKIFFDYWETNKNNQIIGALGTTLLKDDGISTNHSYGYFYNANKFIMDCLRANYGLWKLFFRKIIFHENIAERMNSEQTDFVEKSTTIGNVDWITGADIFTLNNELARFDECIFMYCEDVDLQYELAKQGKKRLIIDGPKIIHFESKSSVCSDEDPFDNLVNFSAIWQSISRVYVIRKRISKFKAFIVKLLTVMLWLNPLIVRKNFKWIPKLLQI